MKTWEHCFKELPNQERFGSSPLDMQLQATFKELGDDGWELVSVVYAASVFILFFKRALA
jgi:hypothetical protein